MCNIMDRCKLELLKIYIPTTNIEMKKIENANTLKDIGCLCNKVNLIIVVFTDKAGDKSNA